LGEIKTRNSIREIGNRLKQLTVFHDWKSGGVGCDVFEQAYSRPSCKIIHFILAGACFYQLHKKGKETPQQLAGSV
jgi:hypothetical protein